MRNKNCFFQRKSLFTHLCFPLSSLWCCCRVLWNSFLKILFLFIQTYWRKSKEMCLLVDIILNINIYAKNVLLKNIFKIWLETIIYIPYFDSDLCNSNRDVSKAFWCEQTILHQLVPLLLFGTWDSQHFVILSFCNTQQFLRFHYNVWFLP